VGALVFPAGLLLAVLVGWHHPGAIAYAALVLGLSDPAAALIGSRAKGAGWSVLGGHKTIAGTVAFVVITFAIGVLMGVAIGRSQLLLAIGAAAVLATMEGSIGYGLDNLPVPAVASALGIIWLGL
jgi:dolichol kinase